MSHPTITRAPATKSCRGAALSVLVLLVALAAGCARPAPTDAPMLISALPGPGGLLDERGDLLEPDAFTARAGEADYVLIGEGHLNPCDHAAERRLLALLADGGAKLAVGLEMVPATRTEALRGYLSGKTALDALPAALDWGKTWGYPFRAYAPIFELLRARGLPAAGLNVPPDVVRRLSAAAQDNATDPAAALSTGDRALLPARIIPPAPEQLDELREVMTMHRPSGPAGSDRLERFAYIQSVWDSAMAEQAVRLRRETGRRVVVLAGDGHVEGGLGIARRLRVLDPGAKILLVAPWRGDAFDAEYQSADGQVRYFCPVSFESRMGMVLEDNPRAPGVDPGKDDDAWRVLVRSVTRGSRAEAAGLRPGDVVERAGGYRMLSLSVLHLAGSDAYREKKPLVLVVRRGDARYSIDLGALGVSGPAAEPSAKPAMEPARGSEAVAAPVAQPVGK